MQVLALGKNVTVAFMPWDGYNYEDAILLSEDLVRNDVYTSIHIDEFEVEIRETKLGKEEFSRDIPNVSEKALRHLDEGGIVRVGTRVRKGDILVGKVAPKSKSELTPEEKLLHAIFGRAGEDVKNASLEVPTGVEGIVIGAEKYSRKVNLTEQERTRNLEEIKNAEIEFLKQFRSSTKRLLENAKNLLGDAVKSAEGKVLAINDEMLILDLRTIRDRVRQVAEEHKDAKVKAELVRVLQEFGERIEESEAEKNKLVNRLSRGDELPQGVLEMVKVYVATKRRISVGDKMAGRHGNKGVISKILPVEDMPFTADGQPVDIILNPLGVPSRMNVGQVLEAHLGYCARWGWTNPDGTQIGDDPVRGTETNCANLIADGLLATGQARAADFGVDLPQLAIINGGGIRGEIDQPAGPIKDAGPLNRWGFAVLGNGQAGIGIGKADNPCADHADKYQRDRAADNQPAFGDAA